MRYVAICFCCTIGCQPSAKTAATAPSSMRPSTVFTDSSIYRARCKEADSLPSLSVIPQKCTPRDQRLIIH
jgi:hypothetical protein